MLQNQSISHPRVVKCSGGRSSGMMLLKLLEKGALQQQRGDVVVFNNTSAEHPATYDFVRRLKSRTEEQGVPFFLLEYQTFEDAMRGEWVRRPAWRLVNDEPYSGTNPDGYRCKGEVFEELLSHMAQVPNMQTRVCTQHMKIFVTNAFLRDWLAAKLATARLGHAGGRSRMTDAGIIAHHKRNNGHVPDEILLAKKAYVRAFPHARPAQRFSHFTSASTDFENPAIKVLGGKALLYGQGANTYISYLGIRADEAHRAEKIRFRAEQARSSTEKSLFGQPPGEQVSAPLVDWQVGRNEVSAFWQAQDFDLALPPSGLHSNCVYCMMKGKDKLVELARENPQGEDGPAAIDWWMAMEQKYSRDLRAERRSLENREVNYIGFFGASSQRDFAVLKQLAQTGQKQAAGAEYLFDESAEACHCTD